MPEVRSPTEYRLAAEALLEHPCVRACQRTTRPDGHEVVLEFVIEPGVDRVPPGVLWTLWDYDFGIRDVSPRGSPKHLIVEAV